MNERVDRRGFLFREVPRAGLKAYAAGQLILAVLSSATLSLMEPGKVTAASSLRPYVEPAGIYFPADKYHPKTGHHLSGDFLDYWRRNRNGEIFGWPVSEQFIDSQGTKVQYLEHVRLEQTGNGPVSLGAINLEYFTLFRSNIFELPNKTLERFAPKYLADFGKPIWVNKSPFMGTEPSLMHTECISFLRKPVEEVAPPAALERMRWIEQNQYKKINIFWAGEVVPMFQGINMAFLNDVETEEVSKRPGALLYGPDMLDSSKHIEIDLESQTLVAYEGDLPVMSTPVSTGKPGYETPKGKWTVLDKVDIMDYSGWNDIGYYLVPGVTANLLFYPEDYIHGAYWHDKFGATKGYGVSVGCVNLDPYDAAWVYNWARIGTPVNIA